MVQVSCGTHPSIQRDSHRVFKLATQFLEAELPISLKYTTLDAFQHEPWLLQYASDIKATMRFWMTAVSTLPDEDSVCHGVVGALFRMAHDDTLGHHIPETAWNWLKKRSVLPRGCVGLEQGTSEDVVQRVQNLRDVELMASYLFVVWSEWSHVSPKGCAAMLRLIREELGGIDAAEYRADLIQRLNDVLPKLIPGSISERQYKGFMTALMAPTCTSRIVAPFRLLTCGCAGCHSKDLHVCASSSVPAVVCRSPGAPSSN